MNDPFSNPSVEAEELFKEILVHVDAMLQREMLKVMDVGTKGEDRAHSAGRLDAFNDLLVDLQQRRAEALKPKHDQTEDK
jgi:hypothetical protein